MKRILLSSLIRAVCAVAIGVLLICFPGDTEIWITLVIGVIFLISGLLSCLSYFSARRSKTDYTITDQAGNVVAQPRPSFPLVGIGSAIFGIVLVSTPGTFIKLLMYIMGIILVLGAVNQLMALFAVRRLKSVSWMLWVCPTVILLVGLYVLFHPFEASTLPMIIIGWCSMLYGVTEIINAMKIYAVHRFVDKLEKAAAEQAAAAEAAATERESDDN